MALQPGPVQDSYCFVGPSVDHMSILYGNTETASVESPSRHVTLRKGFSLFCKFGNEAPEASLLGPMGRRQQPGGVGGAAPGAK